MKELISVLLLGRGGKESAIAWKLLQSSRLAHLYCAPAPILYGDAAEGVDPADASSVRKFVAEKDIDLIIIGDERLIIDGMVDALEGCGAKVAAPCAACARLEGSKEFAKEFMFSHFIPTARFMTVTSETIDEGEEFLASLEPPYVMKADGPASGRGVVICNSLADAKDTLDSMLGGLFGQSSSTVVIEEFLHGRECSVIAACDGEEYRILPPARDYKRLLDGDEGPNTSGMGSYSPVEYADEDFIAKVENRILIPTLKGLKDEGLSYVGFLYLGIISVDGEPMLLEYNTRLGDPEAECILPRLDGDFIDLLEGIVDGTILLKKYSVSPEACASVAVAAPGYPNHTMACMPVNLTPANGTILFPADVEKDGDRIVSCGGRVAVIAAMAQSVAQAAEKAFFGALGIEMEGRQIRNDIGK